jgi:drug/metabolite transporter (DMT)-like permease
MLLTRSRASIVLAALLFSTGGAAIKGSELSAWWISVGRSAIAAAVILAILPESRRLGSPRVWVAGVAYAATLVSFAFATKLTTAAAAIWLQATGPLYMLFLAPPLLGERVRPRDVALGLVLLAAMVVLFLDARHGATTTLAPRPVLGNVLGAVSGLTFALTVLALRQRARHGQASSLPVVVAGNFLACAATLPPALASSADGASPSAADVAGVLYLGCVQVGLAYWLLDWGIRRVTAFEASALLLVEPATNPLWAWLATGERPSWLAAIGGVVIVTATFLHAAVAAGRVVVSQDNA